MADSFNLGEYTRPHDSLPKSLWRVTHSNSQHRVHPETAELIARGTRTISDEESLKRESALHFKWRPSKEPSCFLSVFADEDHALNWARQRAHTSRKGQHVYITRIFTAMLPPSTHVFDATTLCEKVGIEYEYSKDELIFLHRIPWQSLGCTRNLLHHTPLENSEFALVRLYQQLNDPFWAIMERFDARIATFSMRGDPGAEDLANSVKIMSREYQAIMRTFALIITFDTLGSGQRFEWNMQDPDVELVFKMSEMAKKTRETPEKIPASDQPSPGIGNLSFLDISRLTLEDR